MVLMEIKYELNANVINYTISLWQFYILFFHFKTMQEVNAKIEKK